MEDQKEKILYLESLRGIAALMVAMSHFRIDSFIYQNQFVGNSYLWVDFFFVLSGFVIALNYQFKIKNFHSLFTFQAKRFVRLYPLHLILLFIFLGLEYAEYYKEQIFNNAGIAPAFSKNTFPTFVHNIFLTHNIFLNDVSWNYPSWSISAEFYTYFLFGLILLKTKSSHSSILWLSSILVLLSLLILFNTSMETSQGIFRCLYSFFLGVIIFNINNIYNFKVSVLFSYMIFILALLGIYFAGPPQFININIVMPIIFASLIYSLLRSRPSNQLIRILNLNFLIFLGAISYSIYMIHALIWKLISIFLRYAIDIEGSQELAMITDNEFFSGMILISSMGILVFVANITYKYIELRFNKYRKYL